jgi:hypothetical protein
LLPLAVTVESGGAAWESEVEAEEPLAAAVVAAGLTLPVAASVMVFEAFLERESRCQAMLGSPRR